MWLKEGACGLWLPRGKEMETPMPGCPLLSGTAAWHPKSSFHPSHPPLPGNRKGMTSWSKNRGQTDRRTGRSMSKEHKPNCCQDEAWLPPLPQLKFTERLLSGRHRCQQGPHLRLKGNSLEAITSPLSTRKEGTGERMSGEEPHRRPGPGGGAWAWSLSDR